MKRPIALYFVAAWCLLVIYLAILGEISHIVRTDIIKEKWQLWASLLTSSAITAWLIIGLLQLKSFPRWICVAFLACLTTVSVLLFMIYLLSLMDDSPELRQGTFNKLMVGFILITSPSLLSIWYLSRRSFREFARQFVEERQKRG